MSDVEIISRKTWGAQYRAGFGARRLPTSTAWLHHSVTLAPDLKFSDLNRDGVDDDERDAMRTLERIGQQRFGGGFSYNLALMPSGRLYEGCGIDRVGAHTARLNTTALGLVVVGDYSRAHLTRAQVTTLAQFLQTAARQRWIDQPRFDGGHRDAPGASTACPGAHAHAAIPEINRLAAGPEIGGTDQPYPTTPEDPMYQAIQREDGAIALTAPGFFLHVSPEAWAVAQRTGQAKAPVNPPINAREWDVARAIALGGEEPEQERAAD